jgi:hypothetical protein
MVDEIRHSLNISSCVGIPGKIILIVTAGLFTIHTQQLKLATQKQTQPIS